jgi:hypothetical protein
VGAGSAWEGLAGPGRAWEQPVSNGALRGQRPQLQLPGGLCARLPWLWHWLHHARLLLLLLLLHCALLQLLMGLDLHSCGHNHQPAADGLAAAAGAALAACVG